MNEMTPPLLAAYALIHGCFPIADVDDMFTFEAVVLDRTVRDANGDVVTVERAYERIERVTTWIVATKRDWSRTSFGLSSVGGSMRVQDVSSENPWPDVMTANQ